VIEVNQIQRPANLNRFENQQKLKESPANLSRFEKRSENQYQRKPIAHGVNHHHHNTYNTQISKPPEPPTTTTREMMVAETKPWRGEGT
jgi:hypothetical protein